MNEVHDVQPGHIYQPGNKKEVRLVYRILSGPYCGRHQKSFSLTVRENVLQSANDACRTHNHSTGVRKIVKSINFARAQDKWGVAGAWDAAQQAKAYMLQTGRLPPSFASPYSRSKLTNASANAIVLSKPLQPPRPLIHPGAVPGGHARADAASLLASAATGAHLNLDTTNAAIAAAASRFLPLESFSAVAAAARSLPPHHTHGEKDGPVSALPFSAFSDNLPAPFPSFLPHPTFPARHAAAASPAGGWSYLSSVHATLAAAAAAHRASEAGPEGHLRGHENADEHTVTGHDLGPYTLEQENSSNRGCVASAAETRIRGMPTTAGAEAGDGGAPMMSSYQESVATHPSALIGVHMLSGAARAPSPFPAAAAADGVGSAALPASNATPSATTNTRTTPATAGQVNPAAAAATAFTLLQLAEQNATLPQAKDQQQLNHNALQHFMLLHQLQMMQEKQRKEAQPHQEEHERFCPLKSPPLHPYQPAEEEAFEAGTLKGTETADEAEEAGKTAELGRQEDAACAASATSAESDLTRAASIERWQNETCSPAAVGSAPPPSHDATQLGRGSVTCPNSPETLSQEIRHVSAMHDAFTLLQEQRQHQHQHHHAQHQECHEQQRQSPRQQNDQLYMEEGNYEGTSGMRETLRNLLIAASLQQQRLHQQHLAVTEHLQNHHPHVGALAIKGLALGRPATAPPPPPGLLNISALASLLPGAMLSQKQQMAADAMMTHNSSPNHRGNDSVGTGCFLHAGPPGRQREAPGHSALEEENPTSTLLSAEVLAAKDVGFPSQLSHLWGFPQVDHLAVKHKTAVPTAAGAAGNCATTRPIPVCSLETGPPLASAASLSEENFTLLNNSAAAAAAARLKGLPECARAVLQHNAVSSSEGVANVEGECEAMSSCPRRSRDECERDGEEQFQVARMNDTCKQLSLLQNLSPSPLQILPASNAAASPLRLAAGVDSNENTCSAAGTSNTDEKYAVAGAVTPASARCHALMHPKLQHGAHLSPMAVRDSVTAASKESAAAVSNPAALQTCCSPNNTPSRTSGSKVQPYSAAAAADACTQLRPTGCTGSGDVHPSGDGQLYTDTRGHRTRVTSLVSNLLQVSSSMVMEPSAPVNRVCNVDLSEKLATDAGPGDGMCDPAFVMGEKKSTDSSSSTTANAAEGHDRSCVFEGLTVEASGVASNDNDIEEDECSNGTRSGGVQESINRCDSSSTCELRRKREPLLTAGADEAPAPDTCSLSCFKRTRADLCAQGIVSDSPTSDSQDEKEGLMRTRSRTADGKQISGPSDAGRVRTVGKHHTRRRLYF